MSAFDVILQQCETQAEKLCFIEMDDKYTDEIDIFNNYFVQLKQIIEHDKSCEPEKKVGRLSELLQTFIKRIQDEHAATQEKINNLNKNRSMVGYGAVKYQFAHRINRRY